MVKENSSSKKTSNKSAKKEKIDSSSELTKTRAKKCLFLKFGKENLSILKEIKKTFKNVILTKLKSDDKNFRKYQIEFGEYAQVKQAKNDLQKKFNSDLLKIESPFALKKKETIKQKKMENRLKKENGDEEIKKKPSSFEITIPKLILRNLNFKINEEHLKKEMEKYGTVKLVSIPLKDGKMKGFGFVQFETLDEAKKAIAEVNSPNKKIMGKKVVVDWCLPKNIYIRNNSENKVNGSNETSESKEENKPKNGKKHDGEKAAESDDQDSADEDEDMDEEEDEENDDDDDEEEDDEDDESHEDDDEDDEDDEDSIKNQKKKAKPVKNVKFEKKAESGTLDVLERRTVFLRNISFDTTEATLEQVFSRFGKVKYVKLCMDRELERARGTGFVQFEDSQGAINACAESDMLEIDFRKIKIDMAMSRGQVNKTMEEQKNADTMPKDKRNLALAKEGLVYPRSYEAEGLSKSDLQKRQKLEAMNTQKLKLLHYFVSPTRLSVHNIPIKCTDAQLREIFLKAIGEEATASSKKFSAIVECRIMRDLTRVNSEGVAKSKGFGFVEFKTHQMALKALRATNNNPSLFPNGTRLIVQFSIEDMRALKKKQERSEKFKNKPMNSTASKNDQQPTKKQPTSKRQFNKKPNNSSRVKRFKKNK